MLKKNTYKKVTWIDLENPTNDEARSLIDKYDIDPLIASELLSPTVRPRVDLHKNYIYLILHFPVAHSNNEDIPARKIQEVDFIIGKDFIITTRYDEVDALHDFSKVFEVNTILDKSDMGNHSGYVFFYMIQHLYKTMTDKVENVRDLLTDIENQIFAGNEKNMVIELSRINRILLAYKESISTHKEVLVSFELVSKEFFGEKFGYHSRSIIGEFYKVKTLIASSKEYLDELRMTNDSLLTTKQNETMKILTILAFVTFPLSLIAGIFGMNTLNIPIIGHPLDFWIVLFIMLLLTFTMFMWFKWKKWL